MMDGMDGWVDGWVDGGVGVFLLGSAGRILEKQSLLCRKDNKIYHI
jgi:hypothetical protein